MNVAGTDVDGGGAMELLIGLGGGRANRLPMNVVDTGDGSLKEQEIVNAFTDGYGDSVAFGDLGV